MSNARRMARRIAADNGVNLPAQATAILAELAAMAVDRGMKLVAVRNGLEDNDEGVEFLDGIIESLKALHKAQYGAYSEEWFRGRPDSDMFSEAEVHEFPPDFDQRLELENRFTRREGAIPA